MRLKTFIIDNPKINTEAGFQEFYEGDCKADVLNYRYSTIRGRIIDALPLHMKFQFKRKGNFQKPISQDCLRLQKWLERRHRSDYDDFVKAYTLSGNPEHTAYCAKISRRKFNDCKLQMKVRGMIPDKDKEMESLMNQMKVD